MAFFLKTAQLTRSDLSVHVCACVHVCMCALHVYLHMSVLVRECKCLYLCVNAEYMCMYLCMYLFQLQHRSANDMYVYTLSVPAVT